MIRHVVMWQFKEDEEENMHRFLEGLKALDGQIPALKSMEIGVSMNPANNFDAVLIAEFDSMEDLETYKNDPRHQAVAKICKAIRRERAAVDFEE